ncbi:MAG TPA: ferritin-like domain-containing protein [Candidatus Didemnitutus sp.]|nr:ferritin-like domain-containing protein [Candidatus Didemnitutus sp.]
MSKITNLRELFIEELRDLYHAENQLVKALPKMAKAATHETLREGFEQHLEETKHHVERLEQVFETLGEKPKGRTCEAMKGLIAEGEEWIAQKAEPSLKDAGLIVAAQKVEHYEIAGYGSVRTFAERLGFDDLGAILQETLDEEAETDKQLTDICEALELNAGELTGGVSSSGRTRQ